MSDLDRNSNGDNGIDDLSPDELLRRLLDKVESEKSESAKETADVYDNVPQDDAVNELFDMDEDGDVSGVDDIIDAEAFDAAFGGKEAVSEEKDLFGDDFFADELKADGKAEPETVESEPTGLDMTEPVFEEPVFEEIAEEEPAPAVAAEPAPTAYKTIRYRVTGHIRNGVDLLAKTPTPKAEKSAAPAVVASVVETAVAAAETVVETVVETAAEIDEELPIFKTPDFEIDDAPSFVETEEAEPEPRIEKEQIAENKFETAANDLFGESEEVTADEPATDEIIDVAAFDAAADELEVTDEDSEEENDGQFMFEEAAEDEAPAEESEPVFAEDALPSESDGDGLDYSEALDSENGNFDEYFGETESAENGEAAFAGQDDGTPDINGDGKIDDEDIQLMLALGLEDQLSKTVAPEAITRVTKKISDTTVIKKVNGAPNDSKYTEYVNHAQTREIIEEYAKSYGGAVFSVVAAIVLAAGLFFYENISLFGITLSGPFNMKVYSLVYYMVDLQLLVLALASVYKNFLHGLKGLISFNPTPESVLALGGIVGILYTVLLGVFGVNEGVQLFSFPISLAVLATALYNLFNLRREILSFNVISAKKPKYSISLKDENDSRTERKTFSDYIDEASTVARVDKSSFIDGFFARTDAPAYYGNKILLCVLIPLIAAVLVFIAAFLVGEAGISASVRSAMLAFTLCLPATVLFTYSYPFYAAEKVANDMGGAIVGNDTLEEFSSSAVLVYDDVDLFRPYGVKVRSIKIFGEHRIDRVIYNSASIFCGLGGMLGEVFKVAASDLGYSENVEYREIVQNGISADIDGVPCIAGTRKYMLSKGIELIDEDDSETGDDSVMYLATRGEAAAKMYITYDLDPDIDFVVEELNNAGICLGINSTDPNINDEMIAKKIKNNVYPIKIICRQSKVRSVKDTHASSGIVSRDGVKSLITSVILCDKVRQVYSTNFIIKILAMVIGAVLAGILVFGSNTIGAGSAVAGLYQLLWFLPMMIITKIFI